MLATLIAVGAEIMRGVGRYGGDVLASAARERVG
jgi:hypothetical protein